MKRQDLQKIKLPDAPGVYTFVDAKEKPLYIGKATSLRERVRSYLGIDLFETRGEKIVAMMAQAKTVTYEKTDSALEALILEAKYIRKHKPPYNTDGKDDKTYNHVVITREQFPRVLIMRGRELEQIKAGAMIAGIRAYDIARMFGPFPEGGTLKRALALVRKLFPFRDACTPLASLPPEKQKSATPCFNSQIGLCPGVCAGKITAADYKKNIRNIVILFDAKKKDLVKELTREMKAHAAREEFEKAAEMKRTIFALQHIQDIALLSKEFYAVGGEPKQDVTLEAYDIAHFGGADSVGVMVVVSGGQPLKGRYRMFKIRGDTHGNDIAALTEVLERRLAHTEWPLPDMVVVDGGMAQRNAAQNVLRAHRKTIPIVGVVKNERHEPEKYIGPQRIIAAHLPSILLANSESHRFAIRFHRRLRRKPLRGI